MLERRSWIAVLLVLCLPVGALGLPMAALAGQAESEAGAEQDDEVAEDVRGRIYRYTDDQGNVIFSDDPPSDRDSEEVQLRERNIVPGVTPRRQPARPAGRDDREPPQRGYESLKIVAPEHEQTFHNPYEPIQVNFEIEPSLRPGDSAVLLHNGEAQEGMMIDGSHENLFRGPHELVIEVRRGEEVVKRSEPVTIFVHRASRLNRP